MISKECIICKENKELSEFPTRKDSKDGCRNNCRDCEKSKRKKYYKENKCHIKLTKKKYEQKNKDKIREYRVTYEKDNKNKIINRNKKYYKDNKEIIAAKNKVIKKNRLKNDPLFKLKNSIQNSIRRGFRRSQFNKNSRTIEILGCTYSNFREHLESKFESWMTWDNYGLYNGNCEFGWDLDHIIPVSSATNEYELIELNHYTNFQPLCSHINRDIKKDNH
jgi:hypothetical protein